MFSICFVGMMVNPVLKAPWIFTKFSETFRWNLENPPQASIHLSVLNSMPVAIAVVRKKKSATNFGNIAECLI